jgi:hypothetical protein
VSELRCLLLPTVISRSPFGARSRHDVVTSQLIVQSDFYDARCSVTIWVYPRGCELTGIGAHHYSFVARQYVLLNPDHVVTTANIGFLPAAQSGSAARFQIEIPPAVEIRFGAFALRAETHGAAGFPPAASSGMPSDARHAIKERPRCWSERSPLAPTNRVIIS